MTPELRFYIFFDGDIPEAERERAKALIKEDVVIINTKSKPVIVIIDPEEHMVYRISPDTIDIKKA